MSSSRRFCYTLDVLTDGSEHTGCGTLFLSVWKIPLSIRNAATSAAAAADYSDSGSSDSGASDSSSLCSEDESEEEKHNPKQQNNIDAIPNENNPDLYSWLIGGSDDDDDEGIPPSTTNVPTEDHTPIARYAISGFGDATARLCADQRFKLKPTRACFVPERGTLARASDGLSALFLALYGAGVPSLHLVVPSSSSGNRDEDGGGTGGGGGGFVEELATIILGKHKNLDIRTCEVREPNGNDDSTNSPTWWKVYEDDHLIVHASSSKAFLSPPAKGSSFEGRDHREQQMEEGSSSTTSLVYLYSFPIAQLENNRGSSGKNPYCTLALLPPRCRDVEGVYERLVRQNLPMVRDDIPMSSIDYVLFLDPNQPLSSSSSSNISFDREETDETKSPNRLAKCSRILMTLPRNHDNPQQNQELGERSDRGVLHDEGILIRSQQLHRHFYRSMPWAFAEPISQSFHTNGCPNIKVGTDSGRYFVLKSGTSIVLENNTTTTNSRPQHCIWDRRKRIWKKYLKEEWTRPTLDSLQSFLVRKPPQVPSTTPTAVTDENEIELDDESETEEEDFKEPPSTIIEDENEIDLDDEDDEESFIEEEESNSGNNPSSSEPIDREKVLEKNNGIGETDQCKRNTAMRCNAPCLLVLGTGSATPSAYRGASGYALILPSMDDAQETQRTNQHQQYYCGNAGVGLGGRHQNDIVKDHGCEEDGGDQIYLLDCGEGVSTMLSRNCGHLNDWTRRVRGIWISHAHLDHYGGLPTLLRLLCKERESSYSSAGATTTIGTAAQRSRKRLRHSANCAPAPFGSGNTVIPVPWIVAPVKVLKYLDLVLDCQHGRSKDGKTMCFEPRLHHDPRLPSGRGSPFSHFENLRVHHNCCPAFGLLVGWKRKNSGNNGYSNQFLCYSGDTRPSQSLVRACNRALQQRCHTTGRFENNSSNRNRNENNHNVDLFLIHEATFRDAEGAMAQQKKHSTIGEAQMVATDIPGCSRVLMSHFSQRYDNVAVLPGTTANDGTPSIFEKNHAAIGSADANVNHAGGSGGSSSCNDYNANNKFGNANIGPPSIGLAVDGLWINLD
jgi:ribonuclease BN (tRNA processing enzyme)